jgi:hypothetical protein
LVTEEGDFSAGKSLGYVGGIKQRIEHFGRIPSETSKSTRAKVWVATAGGRWPVCLAQFWWPPRRRTRLSDLAPRG